jgi:hypothetical protein
MLKTVSSITNAIGALNFKGTWDANANSPALASSVGTKGDYYVVGTAGSTNLNGISNWGVGDLATFNGSVWQRVEGGADLNGVNLSVSGTSTLSGLTASTALALNASKEVVSVTNTGTGDNVLATSPTLVTPSIGAATATSVNKVALTAPATAATLTIADGKTLTANRSLTLTGTDATTMTFPSSNATVARTDAAQTFSGNQTFSGDIVFSGSKATNATRYQMVDASAYLTDGEFNGYTTTGLRSVFYSRGVFQNGSDFSPNVNNVYGLGNSTNRWSEVFAVNGVINTSDVNAKTEIAPTMLGLDFINALQPKQYKMKQSGRWTDGELIDMLDDDDNVILNNDGNPIKIVRPGSQEPIPGKRIHQGLIAQEVKAVLDKLGVDSAIWISGEDGQQGLRYEELIAPMIKAMQEQQAQIETLKAEVATLKGI